MLLKMKPNQNLDNQPRSSSVAKIGEDSIAYGKSVVVLAIAFEKNNNS